MQKLCVPQTITDNKQIQALVRVTSVLLRKALLYAVVRVTYLKELTICEIFDWACRLLRVENGVFLFGLD